MKKIMMMVVICFLFACGGSDSSRKVDDLSNFTGEFHLRDHSCIQEPPEGFKITSDLLLTIIDVGQSETITEGDIFAVEYVSDIMIEYVNCMAVIEATEAEAKEDSDLVLIDIKEGDLFSGCTDTSNDRFCYLSYIRE